MSEPLEIVLLDNVDSFSFNLVEAFASRGLPVTVFRNDVTPERVLAHCDRTARRLLVISPGPGTPASAGNCLAVVTGALGRVPLLGVCLGHQALIQVAGGTIGRAPTPCHGMATVIRHDGGPPFDRIPSPMPVGRYHSLAARDVPPDLVVAAEGDGVVMAVRHRTHPAIGLQFHPESILTPAGGRLVDNAIQWAADVRR